MVRALYAGQVGPNARPAPAVERPASAPQPRPPAQHHSDEGVRQLSEPLQPSDLLIETQSSIETRQTVETTGQLDQTSDPSDFLEYSFDPEASQDPGATQDDLNNTSSISLEDNSGDKVLIGHTSNSTLDHLSEISVEKTYNSTLDCEQTNNPTASHPSEVTGEQTFHPTLGEYSSVSPRPQSDLNTSNDIENLTDEDLVDGYGGGMGLLPDLSALLPPSAKHQPTPHSSSDHQPTPSLPWTITSPPSSSNLSASPGRRDSTQSLEMRVLQLSLDPESSNTSSSYTSNNKEMLSPASILAVVERLKTPDIKSLIRELVKDNLRLVRVLKDSNDYLLTQQSVINRWIHKLAPEKGEKLKDESSISVHNLSSQLDVAEEAQAQLSQDLQRVTGEKLELGNQVSELRVDLEQRRAELMESREKQERIEQENWEINRVNTDLQQRLQQTVALAHMQAEGNESRLQEEVGTLLVQLEEEREVTAKLSKNLELERRKHESFEQKTKGSSGKKDGARRRSSLLPEEIRDSESRLIASMDLYRHRCENLGSSLASCQQQLDRDSWHPDLATEISKLRKLLGEEKRSCHSEGDKLKEVHQLFEQVYMDYTTVLDSIKQDKKHKGQNVLENIKESNIRDNVDSLTARLIDTEESLNRELDKSAQLQDLLARMESEVDSLPLLQAQVEVYQSDFNAEREARERIAGEKADLLEELNKLKQAGGQRPVVRTQPPRSPEVRRPEHVERPEVERHRPEVERHVGRPEGHLVGNMRDRLDQMREDERLPLPVRLHNQRAVVEEERGRVDLNCPKCGREFRNTTLLTRHVNDCLDRDF